MVNHKDLIYKLEFVLPLDKMPFKVIAEHLGIGEKELLDGIKRYIKNGVIRRFGAVLNHRRVGFKTNALVCWRVKKNKINLFTKIAMSFSSISHCYLRDTHLHWPYNIYTMIHCRSRKECIDFIKDVSLKTNIHNYRVLFTKKELKKTRIVLKGM